MKSNDEVVIALPNIYCPSCNCLFDTSRNRIDKYSKQQRKRMSQATGTCSTNQRSYTPEPFPTGEDVPSESPEKNFIVFTCHNMHCDQYNKFKVFLIPRILTLSVKVDLGD
jgi:hypothetical protein